MKLNITILLLLGFLLTATKSFSQERIQDIKKQLEILAVDNPGLDNVVEFSVNGVSLQEFIRGIANTNDLNISISGELQEQVANNFANATVADVLVFLAKEYELDIQFTGNIISISKYVQPALPPKQPTEKVLNISYQKERDLISFDLNNDKLEKVVRRVTDVSGKNVILSPEVSNKNVSVYIKDMPFESALEKFAFANGMSSTLTKDGYYLLSNISNTKDLSPEEDEQDLSTRKKYVPQKIDGFYLEVNSINDISISAIDAPISEIIKALTSELNVNYYLYSSLTGNKTLNLNSVSLTDLFDKLFEATTFTYNYSNGVYLLGERKSEGLRKTTVFQLQNRSIEKIMEFIPSDLKKEVELKEFIDLNSIVISGSVPQTNELVVFLEKIDQVVPVIAIDVIIVDYRKNRSVTTGISAGLGTEPSGPTQGAILPEASFSFSANSLNNIIGSINEGSTINLGKVTPNFYLSVQALETDGVLRVRSTPKLATLNGHEATLSIGNTEYYVNEQSILQGTLNPQTQNTRTYVPVQADLSVSIKPVVSGNDQITLEITVEQSDFTERISEEAPPGKVTRNFTSMLRVKNNEIILLGGLEEKSRNDSGSGLPLISRIPVLKWIFGRRNKSKGTTQLNVFIKPTVIY